MAEVIRETNYGLYVWQMPDGRLLSDGEGRYLNVPGRFGSIKRMASLTDYVHNVLNIKEGKVVFKPDVIGVTDNEHDDMMERMLDGKLPSFYEASQGNPNEV